MENQSITNSSDISSTNPAAVNQPCVQPHPKMSLIIPILVTLLVSALFFGFGGYYIGTTKSQSQKLPEELTIKQLDQKPKDTDLKQQEMSTPAPQAWVEYSATSMPITFQIPQGWVVDESGLGEIRVQNFPNDNAGRGYDSSLDQNKILFSIYEWNTGENTTYLTPKSLGTLNQDCIASGEGDTKVLQEDEIQEGSLIIYYRQTRCSQAEAGKITDSYYMLNGEGDVFRVVLGMNTIKTKEIALDFLKTFKF